MKRLSDRQLKNRFRKIYQEEFSDPNEAFMDFLLDLVPRNILVKILSKGNRFYYSIFNKYK